MEGKIRVSTSIFLAFKPFASVITPIELPLQGNRRKFQGGGTRREIPFQLFTLASCLVVLLRHSLCVFGTLVADKRQTRVDKRDKRLRQTFSRKLWARLMRLPLSLFLSYSPSKPRFWGVHCHRLNFFLASSLLWTKLSRPMTGLTPPKCPPNVWILRIRHSAGKEKNFKNTFFFSNLGTKNSSLDRSRKILFIYLKSSKKNIS